MNQSLSIFARALATENISFAFDSNAETASFDVKNRHLTLPQWDVSETVQTMLIAHEISHALWTPYERSESILTAAEKDGYNRMLLQRIANVVEDVRIEKLMKAKFPGTRRDFFLGYKEIVDADLFKFKGKDFKDSNLVTRLNIYCKWGVQGFLPITLNAIEMAYVAAIDAAQTIDDVYEVAKRIYKDEGMAKTRQEIEQDGEEEGGQKGKPKNAKHGEIVEGETDAISKKDGEVFTATTVTISPLVDYRHSMISTERVLNDFEGNPYNLNSIDSTLKQYRDFVKESEPFVRQLVAQFERRKAADEIRRERPKQTGMLNLDRLHQYRTHDDIFLSKIIKQDGKNHGIVFMLDFSGSMAVRMQDCFLQVLQLVWFCEKAKIPFEVFGFTDIHARDLIEGYEDAYTAHNASGNMGMDFKHPNAPKTLNEKQTSILYETAALVNIASSRDDAAKRERLLAYLYGNFVTREIGTGRFTRLHGTPTVECLGVVTQFMGEWVAQNDIQIPTLMVVTDGQPNGVYVKDCDKAKIYYHMQENTTLTVVNEITQTGHRVNLNDVLGLDMGNTVISTMLDAIRSKFNARIVGMYVDGGNFSEGAYTNFCMSRKERNAYFNLRYNLRPDLNKTARYAAAKEAYMDGCVIVHPDTFPGYDAYFLIRTPKIVKDEDATKVAGNFTKVKNAFVKTMAKRGGSRVFLSRYVDIVAGQPLNKKADGIYSHPAS